MRHDIVPNSCRICLKSETELFSIYKPLENGNKTPREILQEIAGIKLEDFFVRPSHPKRICKSCIPSMYQAFRFRRKVLESQRIISNHLLKECENAVLRAKQELEEEIVTDEEFQYFTEPKQVESEMPLCDNDAMEKGEQVENMILDIKVEEEYVEENSCNVKSFNIVDADYGDNINVFCSITDSLHVKENLSENDSIAKVQKIAASEKTCDICTQSLSECSCMLEHRVQHDTESRHSSTDDKTKNLKELILHTKIHHDPERYVCNVCNKSFTTSGNLQKHMSIHIGIKKHHCKLCNAYFLQRRDLTRHEKAKSHQKLVSSVQTIEFERENSEIGHKCSICGKSFPKRKSLKEHYRRHNSELRHACTICNKRFDIPSDLNRHQSVHSDHRPYVCNVCNKSFKTSECLQKHIYTHIGIKKYHCEFCKMDFLQRRGLTRHEESKRHQDAVNSAQEGSN